MYAAAALRFSIASVILLVLWLAGAARPGPRTRRELGWMLAAGLFNAASYALVYSAETRISGGLTAVLFGSFPLVTALIAAVTRTEAVRASALAGSFVSLIGITVLFWDRLQVSAEQAWAVVMTFGAVVLSAIYSVIIKREASQQHPLAATGAFLSTTAVGLWALSAVADDRAIPWPPPAEPTVALLYLGIIGSVVVYAAYFALLRRDSLMAVTTLVFIQPLIAMVVDVLWEEDIVLDGLSYVGGAIILAGVAVNVVARQRRIAA